MTNEEAIEKLKGWSPWDEIGDYDQFREALDMAISALESQPCEDAISREAVKEMLTKEWTKYMPMELDMNLSFVLDKISELPPATPKTRWIPVSERLPDIKEHHVSEPYIVYCENGAYGFAELEENIFGQVGWDCERDDEYHEPLGEVLAWMPLPQPYKAESEE